MRDVEAVIDRVVPRISVIGACTPRNLREELEALAVDFSRGRARRPRFAYAPAPPAGPGLHALKEIRDRIADEGPWGALYAGRLHELWLEGNIAAARGTDALRDWVATRYPRRDRHHDEADRLCAAWLEEPTPTSAPALHRSDDAQDPRSLVRRLTAAVGARRLPVRVIVAPQLSALAATGPNVVYVGAGRTMTDEAVRRTVLHEIEGHVLPRVEGARHGGPFARGTAFGSDDQEGRAIALEAAADLLGPRRRRELALRHRACTLTREGADFVTVARAVVDGVAGDWAAATRIAARAQRGRGDAAAGGLARESVYLPAYLRVRAHPGRAPWLRLGQISIDDVPTVRALRADLTPMMMQA
ncbi:MAG: tyrosine/phenylalanine carboxypeptidase domain-containing protein [Myxococcota bacterium]